MRLKFNKSALIATFVLVTGGAGLIAGRIINNQDAANNSVVGYSVNELKGIVVDLQPVGVDTRYVTNSYNTYDFRNGVLIFSTFVNGHASERSVAVPIKDLAEDGRARAMEMYKHLPESAHIKPPKFNP